MKEKKRQDELLDHNYDGIQEYDNDLPKWWVWLFIITVVWGVGYAYWFHFTGRPSPTEQLSIEMAELKNQQASVEHSKPVVFIQSDAQMILLAKEPSAIERGHEIYTAKCAVCHGVLAQGVIGPNLTDTHWIHGGTPSQIRKTIEDGVLAKGMLAWKGILSTDEMTNVIAYLLSIKGTNPPNAKVAEGEFVVE